MKVPKYHYTKYLISVQFDNGFIPDTLNGKMEMCENFLTDLGKLALKSGVRLFYTYSIVSGNEGAHAHFGVSWLPTASERLKKAKKADSGISRYPLIELLESNYFYVDNPKQAIKKVTHNKPYVTSYIIEQPKLGQTTTYSTFGKHPILRPSCSEVKLMSYCSKRNLYLFENTSKNHPHNHVTRIILISAVYLTMISYILLSLF